jgi:hypothetical protein
MINYAVVGAGWISQEAFLPGSVSLEMRGLSPS